MTREEAIRDIEECVIPYVGGISLRMAVEALKEQRQHGEWLFDEKGYFSCSCCRHKPKYQGATTDYCPNCGASMGVK